MTAPLLRAKTLQRSNIEAVARWLISDLPMSATLQHGLAGLLATLLGAQAIKGIVIEELAANGISLGLGGLGLSVFIPTTLFDQYLCAPRPFVFVDILERCLANQANVLDREGIARSNASSGLNLVVHYMQRGWDLTNPHWRAVGALGHQTYVTHHRGYHLRTALQEDWSSNADIYLAAGYRQMAQVDIPADWASSNRLSDTRSLFYADRGELELRAPGSTLSHVFQLHKPRIGFTPAEQRLLLIAMEGSTDVEIADLLGLSLTTVKHTWKRVYERLQSAMPYLIESEGPDGRRGSEKRRHVLAYLDDHPEELRPYVR